MTNIDKYISSYYAEKSSQWWYTFFSFVSHSGSLAVIGTIIICAVYLFYDHVVLPVTLMIYAELLGLLIIIFVRNVIKRNRPRKFRPRLIDAWNNYSFPSHHAYRAFMIATLLSLFYPAFMSLFYSWAILIGFSRIYLLKHYFSDVLSGALLGMFIGVGTFMFMQSYF